MVRLLKVVKEFCGWSGLQIKLIKSVITAFDFGLKQELPTEGNLHQGKLLVRLAAYESFPYHGVRASLVERKRRGVFSPG